MGPAHVDYASKSTVLHFFTARDQVTESGMPANNPGFFKGLLNMFSRRKSRQSECEGEPFDEFRVLEPLVASTTEVPIPRSGHRVWTDGAWLYSVGGYNPDEASDVFSPDQDDYVETTSPLLQEVWRLNLLTDVWSRFPTRGFFPKTVASFAMAHDAAGAQLLLFGGTAIPFGNTASNELHALSLRGPETGAWREIHLQGQSPDKGYGQAFVQVSDNDFYLIGGTSGFQYNMLVHKLSLFREPRTASSSEGGGDGGSHFGGSSASALKGTQCEVRYRHEALFHGGKLIVFGGGTRDNCIAFKTLDAFDVATGLWGSVGTIGDGPEGNQYPAPRRCHALVRHKRTAVVIGGFDGERMFDDVWLLDLCSADGPFQWRRHRSALPWPLYFHSADVSPDGCVYVFGGVLDSHGHRRSGKVLRLWLEPPSLWWLCVRALLRSQPRLLSRPREELRRLGVPLAVLDALQGPAKPA